MVFILTIFLCIVFTTQHYYYYFFLFSNSYIVIRSYRIVFHTLLYLLSPHSTFPYTPFPNRPEIQPFEIIVFYPKIIFSIKFNRPKRPTGTFFAILFRKRVQEKLNFNPNVYHNIMYANVEIKKKGAYDRI